MQLQGCIVVVSGSGWLLGGWWAVLCGCYGLNSSFYGVAGAFWVFAGFVLCGC